MIPNGIDPRRFEYLLSNGLSGREIKEFFRTQRKALLVAGAKVQNIPIDMVAAIRHFNERSHEVLRGWLATHQPEELIADEELVARFRSVEELGMKHSRDESSALARNALHAIYLDSPSQKLVAFLRTTIPTETAIGQVGSHGARVEPQARAAIGADDWLALLTAREGTAPEHIPSDAVIRSAVQLLLAANNGLQSGIDLSDSAQCDALREYSMRARASYNRASLVVGLESSPLEVRAFDSSRDYTAGVVIATRFTSRNDPSLPWFVVAEGFMDDSGHYCLSRADAALALPTTGDVVIFKNRGISEPPINEARLYRVSISETEKGRSKVRAVEEVSGLIRAVPMPCASTDAHLIRSYITGFSQETALEKVVFVTSDNLCMQLRGVALSGVGLPSNDWVMQCWPYLKGIELSSGTYVLEPLPVNPGLLECGPLATVAKRVLNQLRSRSEISIPKGLSKTLIELLSDETAAVSGQTRQRLLANLKTIDASGDAYRELIDTLLVIPEIEKDIAERTREVIEARSIARANESKRLEQLREEGAALEARNRKLEERRSEILRALKLSVRKAFSAATKREIEALGEMSLFTALLSGHQRSPDSDALREVSSWPVPALSTKIIAPSDEQLAEVFSAFGVAEDRANTVSEALSLASQAGIVLVANGLAAGELSLQVARAMSRASVRVVDVPIGLLSTSVPVEWFQTTECDVVLILNANLSDLSVFAPSVLAVLSQRLIDKSTARVPTIILAAATGPAAVSWPPDVELLCASLELASIERAAESDVGDVIDMAALHPLQRVAVAAVNRQAVKEEAPKEVVRALLSLILRIRT